MAGLIPSVSAQVDNSTFSVAGSCLQAATQTMAQNATTANPRLAKQAKEFETFFIQQFISLMQPQPDKNNPFTGGFAEQMFTGKLQEQMAQAVSDKGGFGIASAIVRQAQAKDAYAQLMQSQGGN